MLKSPGLAILASLLLIVASPAARADPAAIGAAIAKTDLEALRREAAAGTEADRRLADAIALSWTGRDDEAAIALKAAATMQPVQALRAAALWELMSLYARKGDFAAAVSAGEAASQLDLPSPSVQQALDFFRGLTSVPPTRALTKPSGRADVKRDLAGLMRAQVTVGGVSAGTILDTGANFSTITESLAARMGLRMLEAKVSVGTASRAAVASRLGIADRLTIGGAEFSNVVFIVLPDKDLSFASGAYKIEAILGMPVFLEMGRIGVIKVKDKESFVFGDEAPLVASAKRNILYNGMAPLLGLGVDVAGKPERLLMLLDSGAQKTSFEGRLLRDYPALVDGAATVTSRRGGAGGTVTSDETRRIAKLGVKIGEKSVDLTNADVHETLNEERHGILGLDALRGGFVIDWRAGVLVAS
jgi:predicted aspartyl protease